MDASLVVWMGLMTLVAAVILAPMLVACGLAGVAWAWCLRRCIVGSPASTCAAVPGIAGWVMLIAALAIALGWLTVGLSLGTFLDGGMDGGFVD